MKDGSKSAKERSRGLNAKNVASRNSVNINRKIKNRFITQRTVLGIFNLISIMSRVVECSLIRPWKRTTKEGFFIGLNNDFLLIFTLEIADGTR